jgi:hypothetical protein
VPRLKFDLQPVGPWRGTVEEQNAHYVEAYGQETWAKHLAPCDCGFRLPDMLCSCWPEERNAEAGLRRLEHHHRQEHKRALRAKREFPWPVHANAGVGWCRWCGKEITNPKTGQRHKQRTWCADGGCLRLYNLHTFHVAQRRHLNERDGPGCKRCGERHTEVDHVIPLGAAWEAFPEPDRRRWFFSPRNLQLLCTGASNGCHVAKSREDVALIKACQVNGREWARAEVLRRLADAGLLRASPAKR